MVTEFGTLTDLTPGREGTTLDWVPMGELSTTVWELSPYERAGEHFDNRRYSDAARELEALLDEEADATDQGSARHGTTAARLLLARSYYHSAQLAKAEAAARGVLESDPTDSYAALLLGRSLERQGRREEATQFLRLAELFGHDVASASVDTPSGVPTDH